MECIKGSDFMRLPPESEVVYFQRLLRRIALNTGGAGVPFVGLVKNFQVENFMTFCLHSFYFPFAVKINLGLRNYIKSVTSLISQRDNDFKEGVKICP